MLSPEERERDQRVRTAARTFAISYVDAAAFDHTDQQLAQAEQDIGRSDREREDTSRAMTARPFGAGRDEDWERDRRRVAAAGFEIDEREWQTAVEAGEDLVYERAAAAREHRVQSAASSSRDLFLDAAQRAEASRRQDALEAHLRRSRRREV